MFISSVISNSAKQHDPEDEPVVASLDPDYFDFDRKFLSNLPVRSLTQFLFLEFKDDLTKVELKGT
jgi:hypothetical protein